MEEDERRGLISILEEENGTGLASFFYQKTPIHPRPEGRGWIGVGRAGLDAQAANHTLVLPEPSMGEGNTAVEAPSFRAGRTSTPEAMAMQNNLGRLVRLAIDDLPPEFRLVVLLADVEGFTSQEIADTVGCPMGTVMSRLHRGRHLLHTTLHALIEE